MTDQRRDTPRVVAPQRAPTVSRDNETWTIPPLLPLVGGGGEFRAPSRLGPQAPAPVISTLRDLLTNRQRGVIDAPPIRSTLLPHLPDRPLTIYTHPNQSDLRDLNQQSIAAWRAQNTLRPELRPILERRMQESGAPWRAVVGPEGVHMAWDDAVLHNIMADYLRLPDNFRLDNSVVGRMPRNAIEPIIENQNLPALEPLSLRRYMIRRNIGTPQ